MKSKSIKIIMALMIGILLSVNSNAQKSEEDEKEKKENALIESYLKKLDEKIKKAFEADKPLKDAMEAELNSIAKMSNDAEMSKALGEYKKKYGIKYFEILKAAGITSSGISDELKKLLPDWNWNVSATFEIKGSKSENTMKKASKPAGGKVNTSKISFNFSHHKSCSLIAGSNATHTSNSLTATSAAVVAGGCSSTARFENITPLSAYSSATVTMNCNATVRAVAVGIPGFAHSKAEASVRGQLAYGTRSISVSALALFLWSSENSNGFELNAEELPLLADLDYFSISIMARTNAGNFNIGSGTFAEAKITGIDFKLNVVQ
jgi:hypothetical protein